MNPTIIGILLIVVSFILAVYTSRTKTLVIVNEKCNALVDYIKSKGDDPDLRRALDTPFKIESINKWYDFVGVTLDGGKEVAVCTEGEINDIMHIVIHEMAHVARNDVEHDDAFWKTQAKIKKYAIEGQFYRPIVGTKKLCGKPISDN